MSNFNIFDSKYLYLFMPDGIEFIHNILENIGINSFKSLKARDKGLIVIKKLFDLELIEIFHWGKYDNIIRPLNLNKEQTINFIETVWFDNADFSDFSSMPMFKYKEWYLKGLNDMGLTHTTDWKKFVQEKIVDLEKWIEENKLKNTAYNNGYK